MAGLTNNIPKTYNFIYDTTAPTLTLSQIVDDNANPLYVNNSKYYTNSKIQMTVDFSDANVTDFSSLLIQPLLKTKAMILIFKCYL